MAFDGPYRQDPEEQGAPLAPMIEITLKHNNHNRQYLAIIDSASAITTITAQALQELQPRKKGERKLAGATDDKADDYPLYKIDAVYFAGREYRHFELVYLKTKTRVIVVGRDILNAHEILFDGPQQYLMFS